MSSRSFRHLLVPLLSLGALVAACDGEAPPSLPAETPPSAVAASASAPSAQVLAMADDPLYVAFLKAATQRAKAMLQHTVLPAYEQYGDAAPMEVFDDWASYRAALLELGVDPDDVSPAEASAVAATAGITMSQTAQAIHRAEVLDERYGFLSMTRDDLVLATQIAMTNPGLSNVANDTWGDESVLVELGAESLDPCVVECAQNAAEQWLIETSAAYLAAELFAALGVEVVFITLEAAVLAVTVATYDACVDECGAQVEETCDQDSDCDPKEYCDRGWLTIGKNQCVFSRDEGEICTRWEQCETECCRYHAWSNPVHPVCRPADKCD
jgi:hypothetical protein